MRISSWKKEGVLNSVILHLEKDEVPDDFAELCLNIAYFKVTHPAYDTKEKVIELAHGADVLYCESLYLEQEADKAWERYHLTAKQAGILARKAGVRELVVFHFSPRYTGMEESLRQEARAAFLGRLEGCPSY